MTRLIVLRPSIRRLHHLGHLPHLHGCGRFRFASSPRSLSVSLGRGNKPESLCRTLTGSGRTCELCSGSSGWEVTGGVQNNSGRMSSFSFFLSFLGAVVRLDWRCETTARQKQLQLQELLEPVVVLQVCWKSKKKKKKVPQEFKRHHVFFHNSTILVL